jgi:FlaA1/EpsC-like NDP-sugar epimerase
MIDEFLYKPLEDKTISKIQRFKINNKDLRELRLSFRNKTILISGAAGSIGSQFSKDIWNYKLKPKKIIFLDKDENLLAELNRNLLLLNNFKKIKTEFVCLDLTSMDLHILISMVLMKFIIIKIF